MCTAWSTDLLVVLSVDVWCPGRSYDGGAAAVDAQVGAVDIAGQRAGDERDQVGDLFGPAEAAGVVVEDLGQDTGFDRGPVRGPAAAGGLETVELLHAGGDNDPGADRVDGDAGAVQVLGQRHRQVEQGRLGGRVVGHGGEGVDRLPGADLHDPAPPGGAHRGQEALDAPHGGRDVDGIQRKPVLGRGLVPAAVDERARVVDQDVGASPGQHPGDEPRAVCRVSQAPQRTVGLPAVRPYCFYDGVDSIGPAAVHDHG